MEIYKQHVILLCVHAVCFVQLLFVVNSPSTVENVGWLVGLRNLFWQLNCLLPRDITDNLSSVMIMKIFHGVQGNILA